MAAVCPPAGAAAGTSASLTGLGKLSEVLPWKSFYHKTVKSVVKARRRRRRENTGGYFIRLKRRNTGPLVLERDTSVVKGFV